MAAFKAIEGGVQKQATAGTSSGGEWFEGVRADLEVGDTLVDDGRVLRVTEDGVSVRGEAAVDDLADADATWVAEAAHRPPGGADWVLVLGDDGRGRALAPLRRIGA